MILYPKTLENIKEDFCKIYNVPINMFNDVLRVIKNQSLGLKTALGRTLYFIFSLLIGMCLAFVGDIIYLHTSFTITSIFIFVAAGIIILAGILVPFITYAES